ncbi:MAG: TolC family outer membrane protein [Sulfurimonas sp.]|nr:TolC family outer membrane protein [Sulfurimonas sp.]
MLKKSFICLALTGFISSSVISANSLQQSVVEVLNTNPVIQERLKNFRATQQDLSIVESEYYPSIDLRVSAAYNQAGDVKSGDTSESNYNDDFHHNVDNVNYRSYESSLTFTQNLFDGFSTTNKVDFEEARILAAAYNYLEKSNDMAFQMTSSYINVLRSNELVGTAQENVQINESIYTKVKDLFEAGLTTDSEVKKIQSALSLARSNLTVQKNNALDSEYKYRRILGRMPDVEKMTKPNLDINMPESIERAALYSIDNNPSLLVSRYNIRGAQALWKQSKKEYYPKVDLELSQTLNDHDEHLNGFDQPDDRFRARIIISYNLFRGGSDKATVQKHVSKINQEIEIQRDLKRQVIEGLDLSWSAYHMLDAQLKDLRTYSEFSEKTLELYKEEYDLGRRSLLDLLSAQNDVINARSQIITAEYEQLFSQYRILDAMGLLVVAINGTADEFTSKVNLHTDNSLEVLDTYPVELDVDNDNIADNIDLCDNSLKENNIMPYGCKKD